MDNQESERSYLDRHLTERHLERFEHSIENVRRDISELQKSDSRQHLILALLVAGVLGLDVGKLAVFNRALEQAKPPVQHMQPYYENNGAIE